MINETATSPWVTLPQELKVHIYNQMDERAQKAFACSFHEAFLLRVDQKNLELRKFAKLTLESCQEVRRVENPAVKLIESPKSPTWLANQIAGSRFAIKDRYAFEQLEKSAQKILDGDHFAPIAQSWKNLGLYRYFSIFDEQSQSLLLHQLKHPIMIKDLVIALTSSYDPTDEFKKEAPNLGKSIESCWLVIYPENKVLAHQASKKWVEFMESLPNLSHITLEGFYVPEACQALKELVSKIKKPMTFSLHIYSVGAYESQNELKELIETLSLSLNWRSAPNQSLNLWGESRQVTLPAEASLDVWISILKIKNLIISEI